MTLDSLPYNECTFINNFFPHVNLRFHQKDVQERVNLFEKAIKSLSPKDFINAKYSPVISKSSIYVHIYDFEVDVTDVNRSCVPRMPAG